MADTFDPAQTTAVVFLAGFAIQQALQILDPFVVVGIQTLKARRPNKDLPGGMTDAEFKKAVVALLAFGLGFGAAVWTGVRLLALISKDFGGVGDLFVSALVLGTGTEAINTVLKFAGYVKDAQKPTPEVTIMPAAVTLKVGASFAFRAAVKNAGPGVTWEVVPGETGGQVSPMGVYTAQAAPGAYQVVARSAADATQFAVAVVTVTA